jgi:hypothetical protein
MLKEIAPEGTLTIQAKVGRTNDIQQIIYLFIHLETQVTEPVDSFRICKAFVLPGHRTVAVNSPNQTQIDPHRASHDNEAVINAEQIELRNASNFDVGN